VAGGRDELRFAVGVERGQWALQAANNGSCVDDGRSGVEGEIEQAKKLNVPVA